MKIRVEVLTCPHHPTFYALLVGGVRVTMWKCCLNLESVVAGWDVDARELVAHAKDAADSAAYLNKITRPGAAPTQAPREGA